MKKSLMVGSFAIFSLFLTACSSNQADTGLYQWGNYDDLVHEYYENTGDYAKQEQDLTTLIAKAKESHKQVGPGIYGHLGLLLLKQGKGSEAQAAFQQEQTLYPESRQFMQFLQKTKKK